MTLPDKIALVGIPFDKKSSYLPGSALGPNHIREKLHSDAHNYWTENTLNAIEDPRFSDYGDLKIEDYFDIEKRVGEVIENGTRIIALGGDHSIAFPIVKAHARFYENIHILQIDAHADLYEEFEGDPYSHACPFARILEKKLASRVVQVGIRTLNPHQREQAEKYDVEVIEMKDFEKGKRPKFDKPVYISLDLDGFDPAFAPGLSHPEPGGLTSREVFRLIQNIEVPILGADIVELNPHRDVNGMTAGLAAKLVKEIAGKMFED